MPTEMMPLAMTRAKYPGVSPRAAGRSRSRNPSTMTAGHPRATGCGRPGLPGRRPPGTALALGCCARSMVIAAAYVAGAAAATRPLDVLDLDTVDRFHRVPESGG